MPSVKLARGTARLCFLVSWLCAAQPLIARSAHAFRPCDGTDASITSPHLFELELNPLSDVRTGDRRALVVPEVTFNYGIGGGWEVELRTGFTWKLQVHTGS